MLDRILNPTPTFYKWDRFWVGLLPSLIAPLFSLFFFYLLQMKQMSWQQYVAYVQMPDILSKVLSFGCVLNLGIFFLLINRDYFNAGRGAVAATILYIIPVIYLKFFA
jgi:hypothetical protein